MVRTPVILVLFASMLSTAFASDYRGAPTIASYNAIDISGLYMLAIDKAFGTCPSTATSAASCNPNVPLLTSLLVPDILRFASNVPDGYPNGRRPPDRTADLLISLVLQIPGFTDGTSTKTYCSVFPFLGPPLQLSTSAPFNVVPQACP